MQVLIASVDCLGVGEPICEQLQVHAFPTIRSYRPPDEEMEEYTGETNFDSLRQLALSIGRDACSLDSPEHCSEEEAAALKRYVNMPLEERLFQ